MIIFASNTTHFSKYNRNDRTDAEFAFDVKPCILGSFIRVAKGEWGRSVVLLEILDEMRYRRVGEALGDLQDRHIRIHQVLARLASAKFVLVRYGREPLLLLEESAEVFFADVTHSRERGDRGILEIMRVEVIDPQADQAALTLPCARITKAMK